MAARPRYLEIAAKSVLNRVTGMPFAWSINPYRGCFHQCVFCYARSTHTFLERSGRDDWGSTIFVKANAPRVLRDELARPDWKGECVSLGTATDPYQPAEGRYRVTRAILIELARARTPAHVITRSPLIVRDLDVLQELARSAGVSVAFSVPTLDVELARRAEPTVAPPAQRLRALGILARAGIRAGISLAPVMPYLTDGVEQLRAVYRAAADAGARYVWSGVLNLGEVARESYFDFLAAHHPALVEPYRNLYRSRYATAAYVAEIERRGRIARRGIQFDPSPGIATMPGLTQLSLL
jgi:DNA repair photolyase